MRLLSHLPLAGEGGERTSAFTRVFDALGEPGEGSCCGTPLPPRIRSGPSPRFAGRGGQIATANHTRYPEKSTGARQEVGLTRAGPRM